MPKKSNEARSHHIESGGAAPAPSQRSRAARARAATANAGAGAERHNSQTAVETATVSAHNHTGSDREEIARLAYFLWEARGGEGGTAEEDWIRAEEEYRGRTSAATRR